MSKKLRDWRCPKHPEAIIILSYVRVKRFPYGCARCIEGDWTRPLSRRTWEFHTGVKLSEEKNKIGRPITQTKEGRRTYQANYRKTHRRNNKSNRLVSHLSPTQPLQQGRSSDVHAFKTRPIYNNKKVQFT
jgi:hypothetical protein